MMGRAFGFIFTWNSRKCSHIALTNPEAKYIAVCETDTTAKWLRTVIKKLSFIMKTRVQFLVAVQQPKVKLKTQNVWNGQKYLHELSFSKKTHRK